MIVKIKNQKSKIKNKEVGFTLVELLASVIVLVAVGSIIAGIISSSLRGANKTNSIENIRQNGNYALAQMSKDIEYAQSFDGASTGFSNSSVPTAYDTSCSLSLSPTPTPVTVYKYITVRSTSNIVTQYNCDGPVLKANGSALIDDSTGTTISLTGCTIKCMQNKSTDVPIINISFSIGPKNSNNLVENSMPPIVFETSVAMRNYKK